MPWEGILASPEGFFRNYILNRPLNSFISSSAAIRAFKERFPNAIVSERELSDILARVTTEMETAILFDSSTESPAVSTFCRRYPKRPNHF
ncbi:hypothetical protein GCM10010136_29230 [Limoniibacter endophyticus]|uniref:Uncharacterized protein n=1 Tax=Limoniibacter endophyticus TaxID=1565040 RepID=A0A8J3DUC9_9HYPH|nr:hypothetical protein GCM10010136_29230 [Limoniibacter endophyticus]